MKLTELQEACRLADMGVSSSMLDVIDIALPRVLAPLACYTSVSGPAQHDASFNELLSRCDHLFAQFWNVNLQCDTSHLLFRERENEVVDF